MRARGSGRALAALLAGLLVLAACGGDGDGDDATTPVGQQPEEEGTPVDGGVLKFAATSDIESLDPLASASFNVHNRVGLVYNRLLAHAVGPDVTFADQVLEGDLAERWEVSGDGLTYTFHLRPGVRWQDVPPLDGRPFTADDVVATMEAVEARGHQAYMLEAVDRVEAVDDATVVFHLSRPFGPLLDYMASPWMWILSREAATRQIDPSQVVIGTGPFILESRTPSVEAVYRRNPTFFRQGLPHLDGVEILVVPDQTAQAAAFRTGDTDLLAGLSPQEMDAVAASVPDAELVRSQPVTEPFLSLNQQRAPFTDVRVRQAISLTVDREALGEAIYSGGVPGSPVTPPLGEWSLGVDERRALQPHDPDEARRLLAEAGFPDGFETRLMVTTGYGAQAVRGAEWVVQDLAEVGIDARIEQIDYGTYFGSRFPNLDYDIVYGLQTFFAPDEWLRAVHHSESSRNWSGIRDPGLDRMLDDWTAIVDRDEAVAEAQEIQRHLMTEIVNPIYLYNYESQTLLGPRVRNYRIQPTYGYYGMKDVWVEG